jgi:hypothetical protein
VVADYQNLVICFQHMATRYRSEDGFLWNQANEESYQEDTADSEED